jgi:hypothetical protein
VTYLCLALGFALSTPEGANITSVSHLVVSPLFSPTPHHIPMFARSLVQRASAIPAARSAVRTIATSRVALSDKLFVVRHRIRTGLGPEVRMSEMSSFSISLSQCSRIMSSLSSIVISLTELRPFLSLNTASRHLRQQCQRQV